MYANILYKQGMEKMYAALKAAEAQADRLSQTNQHLEKRATARAAMMEKEQQKLQALKREIEELRILEAEKQQKLVNNAKISAAISILQAKIQMAQEAAAEGFDIKSWDIEAWRASMGKLMGQVVEADKAGDTGVVGVEKQVTEGDEGKDAEA